MTMTSENDPAVPNRVEQLLDSDTGRWRVWTLHSRYDLDLTARTIRRFPGAGVRSDPRAIRGGGLRVVECSIGDLAAFELNVGDPFASVYRQRTSAVLMIERVWRDDLAPTRTRAELIEESLGWFRSQCADEKQVAALLGVTVRTVQRRRQRGRLFSWRDRRVWRYPKWQFVSGGTIPYLRDVLEAARPHERAMTITGLMTRRQALLTVDGFPTSPREWLVDGLPPGPVLALLTARRLR